MAFSLHSLKLIIDLAKDLPRPVSIVCMGYPDVLISPAVLRKEIAQFGLSKLAIREDSAQVMAWHGLRVPDGDVPQIVESTALLRDLGFAPRYVDIVAARGGEIIMDMNEPLAEALAGQFDIVYDAGGMEHYFNVGQAVKNILAFAKVGGAIYHGNPFLACNHGFYNFCPVFYHDFYRQNGHELIGACVALKNGMPAGQLPLLGRFRLLDPTEMWLQVLVRKKHAGAPKWPTQTKYIENPGLQGRLN